MKSAAFVLLALAASVSAETKPITRDEIIPTLRGILLDMHGGASALPRYAERLERERGFTRVQMEDLLLEIAADESWDGFARDNAVVEFIEIARPEELSRLDPFYISTNRSIRASIQSFLLEQLETVPEKLAYARTRLDWLAEHPEFQSDTTTISIGLRTVLHYGQPTDADRRLILDFFWNAATNAPFAESAHEAEMLLLRDDPTWPTNEARRAMMEKWKDDPSLPDKTRALWNETLAAFGTPDADVPPESSGPATCVSRPLFEPASTNSAADAESPLPPLENDNASTTSPDNSSGVCESPSSAIFIVLLALILTGLFVAVRRVSKRRRRGLRPAKEDSSP